MCNTNPEFLPENLPATDEAVASVSEAIMNENAEAYEDLVEWVRERKAS